MAGLRLRRAGLQRRAALPGLLALCFGCFACAPVFLGPGRSAAPRLHGVTRRAAAKEETEAEKTRGVFMSLDSEEFGLDSAASQDKPTKEQEMSAVDQFGLALAQPGTLLVILVVGLAIGYGTFFTKWGEETFYYSAMRDRTARFGGDESGVDFRNFDPSVADNVEKMKAERAAGQEAVPPSIFGN